MSRKLLSKSKYIYGIQCLRYLWVAVNEPSRIPPVDAATQQVFDQGHEVGKLAQKFFPQGIALQTEDFIANIQQTTEALAQKRPLFEAGIMNGPLYCRVDILNPAAEDEWDIIEVKSTTEVKEEHLHDVAFQRFCCQQAGLNIRRCYIMYINNEYVKQGEVDPSQLFITQDVTDNLAECSAGIDERVSVMLEVISCAECPEESIGRRCARPYNCPLVEECWQHLPEHNVFTLCYIGERAEELLQQGITAIGDIPNNFPLNGKQQIQKECVLCGQPHIDRKEIKDFLRGLKYPLHFMDFETFKAAIPIYDGTRPYQNIPFQFSVHVIGKPGDKPRYYSHLAEGQADPRPGFLSELKKAIGPKGSIVVYNQSFEKGRLEELAQAFPEYQPWVDDILSRVVDLLIPFKNFHYYHPSQHGHASIKNVLPALTGQGYDGLEIAEGQAASAAFCDITFGNTTEETRRKVRADLLTYCRQDTEGMIWIVAELHNLIAEQNTQMRLLY